MGQLVCVDVGVSARHCAADADGAHRVDTMAADGRGCGGNAVGRGMSTTITPQFSEPTPTVPVEGLLAALGKDFTRIPEVRACAEARHRALVVEDDYLCEAFGFSRKARGKYLFATPNT